MVPNDAPGGRPGRVAVTFELPATIVAEEVAVVGDFNGWDPAVHPMVREPDGTWRLSLELERRRRYRFAFLLDRSRWLAGWPAGECVPTRSGVCHAVIGT